MAFTRRQFLAIGGVATAAALVAGPAGAGQPEGDPPGRRRIYRCSVRGRRASNAAKNFCANMRFKTKHAAMTFPPPHPGFNGRIVPIDVSKTEFHRLFVSRHSHVADLRQLRNIQIVG